MKILLAQSTVYLPTHGGENKANRLLLEGLAERGHSCCVVAPACGAQGPGGRAQFLQALHERNLAVTASSAGVDVFEQNGVTVHAMEQATHVPQHLATQIRALAPDWTLVSSEDPGQVLLGAALQAAPSRVVYLAHTMLFIPCGPNSFFPNEEKTALLRKAAGIITVSQYLKNYLWQFGRCQSVVIPFPV